MNDKKKYYKNINILKTKRIIVHVRLTLTCEIEDSQINVVVVVIKSCSLSLSFHSFHEHDLRHNIKQKFNFRHQLRGLSSMSHICTIPI